MDRKYSDRYMKFPIKMYKSADLEQSETLGTDDVEGAVGYARICPYDIVEWYQSFSRPRTIEDVKEEGFDCTQFKTRSGEFYNCIWETKKFEERIDAWVEKFEKEIDKTISALDAEE
jgi:hypothetical protein